MNTKVQNFSLVEGNRSRIVIKLPCGCDAHNYTVCCGNDRCQQRHLVYEVESVGDRTITMLSEPAPNCMTIPYQLFIKDNISNVEWFVVSGNVTVIRRVVGGSQTESQEIDPSLSEQILELNVTIEYTKADLDEAVNLALAAAGNAQTYAQDAGSSAGLAWDYAQCAHRAVSDIGSSVESAWSAAGKSEEWSELARQYKEQSCCYKKLAFNYAGAAEGYATTTTFNANRAERAEQLSCQGATISRNNALCALNHAHTAAQYKNEAQLSASSAETYKNQALSYMNQSCSYASTASEAANQASQYSSAACAARDEACSYATSACNAATEAQQKSSQAGSYADCSATWAHTACQHSQQAQSYALCACSQAASARCAADAARQYVSQIIEGPIWRDIYPCRVINMGNYEVGKLIAPCESAPYAHYAIQLNPNSTTELYLDYGTNDFGDKQVSFPACWKWINNDLPESFEVGHVYRIVARDDAPIDSCSTEHTPRIIANVAYDYEK